MIFFKQKYNTKEMIEHLVQEYIDDKYCFEYVKTEDFNELVKDIQEAREKSITAIACAADLKAEYEILKNSVRDQLIDFRDFLRGIKIGEFTKRHSQAKSHSKAQTDHKIRKVRGRNNKRTTHNMGSV